MHRQQNIKIRTVGFIYDIYRNEQWRVTYFILFLLSERFIQTDSVHQTLRKHRNVLCVPHSLHYIPLSDCSSFFCQSCHYSYDKFTYREKIQFSLFHLQSGKVELKKQQSKTFSFIFNLINIRSCISVANNGYMASREAWF